MTVFKTFFKVANKRKYSIVIPLLISTAFAVLNMRTVKEQQTEFLKTMPSIAILNNDHDVVSEGLLTYLDGKVLLETIDEDEIHDNLFYRRIHFALVLPENFSKSFDAHTQLDAEMLVDSPLGYIAQSYVETYLSDVSAITNIGYSQTEAVQRVLSLQSQEASVSVHQLNKVNRGSVYHSFTTMEVYPIMFTIMSILIPTLSVFGIYEVKRRSEIGSMSSNKRNLILMGSVVLYGHVLWIGLKLFSLVILKGTIDYATLGYSFLNSYLFLWVVIALSFLVSQVAKSESSQIAFTTVLSLGVSFISGVFVPQELIGSSILSISKLFPVYWNIEANHAIMQGGDILSSMVTPLIIQLLFVIVFVALGIYISRNRKTHVTY